MTITEFLLARIAEDEAAVGVFKGKHWTFDGGDVRDDVQDNPYTTWGNTVLEVGFEGDCQSGLEEHVARWDPARVLAECTAKRAIIEQHPMDEGAPPLCPPYCDVCIENHNAVAWPCPTIRALVTVYKDHPDFDPAWGLTG
jgi:hypothetical protein